MTAQYQYHDPWCVQVALARHVTCNITGYYRMNMYIAAHSMLWQDLTIPLYHVIPESQLQNENFASALHFQGDHFAAGPYGMWLDMTWDRRVTARDGESHIVIVFFPDRLPTVTQGQKFCRFVMQFGNSFFLFISCRTTLRPFDLSDRCAISSAKASVAREDQVLRAAE